MKDSTRGNQELPVTEPNIIASSNPQFDQILGGGIPQGSLLMLVGGPGTGKTTLALQLCFGWPRQLSTSNANNHSKIINKPVQEIVQSSQGHSINQDANSISLIEQQEKDITTPHAQLPAKVQGGGNSIYFSLLSESHDKLISHAGQFDFFDPQMLNKTVKFFSLSSQLDKGYKEILSFITNTIRQEKAGLVVLDGFTALAELFPSRSATRLFLFNLSSQLAMLGVTALISIERIVDSTVLSDGDLTVADGVITFASRLEGAGVFYTAQVVKLRGMKHLLGLHSYSITQQGVEFYPRLEALVKSGVILNKNSSNGQATTAVNYQEEKTKTASSFYFASPSQASSKPEGRPRKTFGLPELEDMLGGGLPVHSSTLVAGSVGVGKTLLGIHFLMQGVREQEKGLFLGFYESNAALYRKANDFGLDLAGAHRNGMVELLSIPPIELEPDQVMQQVRQIIETKGIKRLVVDGFIELELACRSTSRSRNFTAAFEVYLKQHNITVVYTHSISKVIGSELDLSDTPFARMAENLLLMRQGEFNNRLYRIISILKMRDSDYDRTIREFTVSDDNGIQVLEAAQSVPGLLNGLTRVLDETKDTQNLTLNNEG